VKENDNVAANGRFDSTTALITGGASGIGLAVAGRVIAEGGVATLWDVDQAKLDAAQGKFGPKARAKRVDITNPEEVERAVKDAHAAMGHFDILVCAAGVAGLNADVVDYPVDEWKRVFDVNINGLFYCNRFVGSLMKARGYGRIVNIASVAGKEGNPRACAYSASKAAVIGFTKSLGKELAKDGVTVNAVAPAVIDTPMLEKVDSTHLGYMRSKIPMERFGTVEEVAALICWLASRECSFSTGAVFDISGGRATY
jgi:NAD(P)-dependent dehydrogenase (short-subunit alcohol dehydrogenase family)